MFNKNNTQKKSPPPKKKKIVKIKTKTRMFFVKNKLLHGINYKHYFLKLHGYFNNAYYRQEMYYLTKFL